MAPGRSKGGSAVFSGKIENFFVRDSEKGFRPGFGD